MTRRITVVVAVAAVGLAVSVCAEAQTRAAATSAGWRLPAARTLQPPTAGAIVGIVRDGAGTPVSGAIVSAVGRRTVTGTTGVDGRCTLPQLPAGEYLVRVHRAGFALANSHIVRVEPGSIASRSFVLTRAGHEGGVGTSGRAEPEVLAAGLVGRAAVERSALERPDEAGDHDHSELAWRLRHLSRSVLKESVERAVPAGSDGDLDAENAAEMFGRAMAAPARVAAALFADVPFTGQVNLLTSSTFDSPEQLLSDTTFARGLAYVSVGAAAGQQGDWAVQAAMTQGDVASWLVAGSFLAHQRATHRYEAGMSYAEQRYTGTNAASLAAVADGTRSAGSVFAYDTWSLSRRAQLVYGARYARYGYIARALFSPRASLELAPLERVRVRVSASRRDEAPGADEFAPSAMSNDWLPLQRTFTPLAGERFRPERTETYEVALSHDLAGDAVLGLRTFFQRTEDQVATLFGLGLERTTADVDHYSVASAGDVEARGWSVSVTRLVAGRLRGSVDYTVTTAHWQPSPQTAMLAVLAPSAVRAGSERFHDLTTSLETEIPYTATRVFALYRVNTAFAGDRFEQLEPSPAARFDVQVTQSLPFLDFTSAQWEMLFGIRNMVRELVTDGSVYDELLVVRPPKRVVGGVTVRF